MATYTATFPGYANERDSRYAGWVRVRITPGAIITATVDDGATIVIGSQSMTIATPNPNPIGGAYVPGHGTLVYVGNGGVVTITFTAWSAGGSGFLSLGGFDEVLGGDWVQTYLEGEETEIPVEIGSMISFPAEGGIHDFVFALPATETIVLGTPPVEWLTLTISPSMILACAPNATTEIRTATVTAIRREQQTDGTWVDVRKIIYPVTQAANESSPHKPGIEYTVVDCTFRWNFNTANENTLVFSPASVPPDNFRTYLESLPFPDWTAIEHIFSGTRELFFYIPLNDGRVSVGWSGEVILEETDPLNLYPDEEYPRRRSVPIHEAYTRALGPIADVYYDGVSYRGVDTVFPPSGASFVIPAHSYTGFLESSIGFPIIAFLTPNNERRTLSIPYGPSMGEISRYVIGPIPTTNLAEEIPVISLSPFNIFFGATDTSTFKRATWTATAGAGTIRIRSTTEWIHFSWFDAGDGTGYIDVRMREENTTGAQRWGRILLYGDSGGYTVLDVVQSATDINEDEPAPEIALAPDTIQVSASGAETKITVMTSGEPGTIAATPSANWLTASADGHVSISENPAETSRAGSIVFAGTAGGSATLTVSQEGAIPPPGEPIPIESRIIVSPSTFQIGWLRESITATVVVIDGDQASVVAIPKVDWLVARVSDDGTTITITADKNPHEARAGQVVILAGTAHANITVSQAGHIPSLRTEGGTFFQNDQHLKFF